MESVHSTRMLTHRCRVSFVTLLVTASAAVANPKPEETWPGFRGHGMSGDRAEVDPCPERWSTTENVRWKIDAGTGLVVADRLGRHRVRDVGDQQQAVQAADARALRQRLHRRDAGARGCRTKK